MQDFIFEGPLGPIECLVEPNRSTRNAVLVMAHGFRGSRESGGRAAGIAYQCAAHCSVVRFNFTGTRILSLQVAELRAVIAAVRERQPGCAVYLLGRSLGGAASIVTASQEPELKRLVLWATPNNLRETFRHVMTDEYYERLDAGETLEFDDERGHCVLTPDFLTDFDQYELGKILGNWQGCPVLLLHCKGDDTVLVEQALRNKELLGDNAQLRLWDGGDHSFTEYSEEAGTVIADWLGKA